MFAVGSLSNSQRSAGLRLELDRFASFAPGSQQQRRRDRAGPTSQRLGLDAALVGPDAPAFGAARHKVHVRALGQLRIVPEVPAPIDDRRLVHVGTQDDEMWD